MDGTTAHQEAQRRPAYPFPVIIATRAVEAPPEALVLAHKPRLALRHGRAVRLRPMEFRFLATIAALPCASKADIAFALWGDDPDGGPLTTDRNIHAHVARLRAALADLGLAIVNRYAFGFDLVEAGSARAAA